jgi:hypothetical protein
VISVPYHFVTHKGQAQAFIEYFGTKWAQLMAGFISLQVFRKLSIFELGITGPFRTHLKDLDEYRFMFCNNHIRYIEMKRSFPVLSDLRQEFRV